jgi:hypothetical protein
MTETQWQQLTAYGSQGGSGLSESQVKALFPTPSVPQLTILEGMAGAIIYANSVIESAFAGNDSGIAFLKLVIAVLKGLQPE